MKKFSLFLSLALVCALLAGCAGTPVVYYTDCTCPVEAHEVVPAVTQAPAVTPEAPVTAEGSLKTGLAIATDQDIHREPVRKKAGALSRQSTVL